MGKYDGKEFNDPIVRCDQCSKLTHRKFISVQAGCFHCGNKRFKNVRGLNDEEYRGLKEGILDIGLVKPYTIDKEWFDQFEPAEEIAS